MPVVTSNYPKKTFEKTWKIVRLPGTGPGWILYSGKLGLGSAQFFHNSNNTYELYGYFLITWGHFTVPSHDP